MNKQGLIIIILGAILVFFVWQYFLPVFDEVVLLRQDLKIWQTKLNDARNLNQKLAELKKKYADLSYEAERAAQAITEKEDLPGLLVQLEALSSQNGLILESVFFNSLDDKKNKKTSPSIAGEKILAIDLGLNGSQNSLKSFLKAIETNLRIMDVSAISFSEQDMSVSLNQNFRVSLNAYYR